MKGYWNREGLADQLNKYIRKLFKGVLGLPNFIRSWAIEIGVIKYSPGPWTAQVWDTAYQSGQLDYFKSLSERSRYSVIVGYLDHLFQSEGYSSNANILDVGCGAGILFERARYINFGLWTGVDLSNEAIEQARQLANDCSETRATFISEDMLSDSAKWSQQSYGVIVVNEVLNMCDDPAQLIGKLTARLDENGVILISAWRHRGDRALWKLILDDLSIIDCVDLKSSTSMLAPRGWRVAILQKCD